MHDLIRLAADIPEALPLVDAFNAVVERLEQISVMLGLVYVGSEQGFAPQEDSAPYRLEITVADDIPRYSIFGLQSESWPYVSADRERLHAVKLDVAQGFSPLIFLTNGRDQLANGTHGNAQIINNYAPVRIAIDTDYSLSDFKIGYPCGPSLDHYTVKPGMPGLVFLAPVPIVADDFDRSFDTALVCRATDMSMIGKMTTAADGLIAGSGGGDDGMPGQGKAKILWLNKTGGSGGTIQLRDAKNPAQSGSGDTAFEIPVLNYNGDALSVDDLVGITPVLCHGFAATLLC